MTERDGQTLTQKETDKKTDTETEMTDMKQR